MSEQQFGGNTAHMMQGQNISGKNNQSDLKQFNNTNSSDLNNMPGISSNTSADSNINKTLTPSHNMITEERMNHKGQNIVGLGKRGQQKSDKAHKEHEEKDKQEFKDFNNDQFLGKNLGGQQFGQFSGQSNFSNKTEESSNLYATQKFDEKLDEPKYLHKEHEQNFGGKGFGSNFSEGEKKNIGLAKPSSEISGFQQPTNLYSSQNYNKSIDKPNLMNQPFSGDKSSNLQSLSSSSKESSHFESLHQLSEGQSSGQAKGQSSKIPAVPSGSSLPFQLSSKNKNLDTSKENLSGMGSENKENISSNISSNMNSKQNEIDKSKDEHDKNKGIFSKAKDVIVEGATSIADTVKDTFHKAADFISK
jgi:hypothetical protein